jgi:hypothetical protein
MRTRLWLLVTPLLAVACSQPSADPDVASAGSAAAPAPTASLSELDQAVRYAQCMRSHGVPMGDPHLDGQGNVQNAPAVDKDSLDTDTLSQAQQACRALQPVAPPALTALKLELSREFSRCMRDHGVEHFPDPESDAHVEVPLEVRDDPQYEQAKPLCDEHVRHYSPSPR